MRVTVQYGEEVATPLSEDFFVRVAEATLTRCPLRGLVLKEEVSFGAVAVSRERIQELNRTYRQKDAVTDILSFGEYAETKDVENDASPSIFLGELFFCQDFIAAAAEEDGVTLEHEMAYIFSHGILHLLGYDHSDEMFALQDAVTAEVVVESRKGDFQNKNI